MRLVDERAERAVLAALLVRPACWPDVSALLEPDAFGTPRHRAIADAVWAVRRSGEADVDLVTLGAELDRAGTRKQAGDLGELLDQVVPTQPLKHARRLRDLGTARRFHELLGDVSEELRLAEDDPTAWLEDAARRLVAAADVRRESDLVHVSTLVERHIREIEGRAAGTRRGTPTGLEKLDAMTGGLHVGDFVVLAARPSCGKSALAMQIATHAAADAKRVKVAFFSSEMRELSVMDRLVAEGGSVPLHRVRDGKLTQDEMQGVLSAYRKLRDSGVWLSDRRGWRVNEIVAQVRTWKRQHCRNGETPIVIVDYLQIVKPSQRHSSREQEVAEISGTFQTLAGEESVALVVLAQLGREAEKRGADTPPQLSDLRESGAIEQDADGVWFVHRPDRIDDTIDAGATELAIAKQRNGECGRVPLWFRGRYQRFEHRDCAYERRTPPKTAAAGDKMPKGTSPRRTS